MISVRFNSAGQVEIAARKGGPARPWVESLASDEFFTSPQSEMSVSTPPSAIEEFNEDWEEYALPEVLSRASSWSSRFSPKKGVLRFHPSEKLEVAGFLNRARLKIAMEGTGDVLPPSSVSPRSSQYEFLTALMEFVLSVPSEEAAD